MGNNGYKIMDQQATYFISFAVVGWVDLFTRQHYKDILLESFRYCQQEKGLVINAWCIMTNHVHLIGYAKKSGLSDTLRDLKKFSSRTLLQSIKEHPGESRKEWMLPLFKSFAESNTRNCSSQLWRQDNAPIHLYTPSFTAEKLKYVHNNPVKEGWVQKPEDYLYSSAASYVWGNSKGLVEVEFI